MNGKHARTGGIAIALLVPFASNGWSAAEKLLPPARIGLPTVEKAPGDRAPQARVQITPHYPTELLRRQVEGSATVRVTIDEKGALVAVEIVSATHPEFAKAAEESVRKWKFSPGVKDGSPVTSQLTFPIRFKLEPSPFGTEANPRPGPTSSAPASPSNVSEPASTPALRRPPPVPVPVVAVDSLDSIPKVLWYVEPEYPASLRRQPLYGRVLVTFLLDEDGAVGAILNSEANHPSFGAAAINALRQWRFSPALTDGRVVRTRLQVTVEFPLR